MTKYKKKLLVAFLSIIFIYGCTTHTYQVGPWGTREIINPQFADKAIIVHKYPFTETLKSWIGINLSPKTEAIFTGEASGCMVASLRGTIPEYAVVSEDDISKIRPDAKKIDIKFKDITFKRNFSNTGCVAKIKLEVGNNKESETISTSGEGQWCNEAITKACEKAAEKIANLIEENKQK